MHLVARRGGRDRSWGMLSGAGRGKGGVPAPNREESSLLQAQNVPGIWELKIFRDITTDFSTECVEVPFFPNKSLDLVMADWP